MHHKETITLDLRKMDYRPTKVHMSSKNLLHKTWDELLGHVLFKLIVLPTSKAETLAD